MRVRDSIYFLREELKRIRADTLTPEAVAAVPRLGRLRDYALQLRSQLAEAELALAQLRDQHAQEGLNDLPLNVQGTNSEYRFAGGAGFDEAMYAAEISLSGWGGLIEVYPEEDIGAAAAIIRGIGRGVIRAGVRRAATCAPTSIARGPNRIYSSRVLIRSAEESGPFHNFPESFNQRIFDEGSRTVTPNFWRTPRTGFSSDSINYRLPGSVNGTEGTFEIFVRPSASGNTEVIMHRFFTPNPK